MIKILLAFLVISCAANKNVQSSFKNTSKIFNYSDLTGDFILSRDHRVEKNKVIVRSRILSQEDQTTDLEKTITVSRLGSTKSEGKNNVAMRPDISQYEIWLDSKRYTSQLKIIPKTRSVRVVMNSPDEKWKGPKTFVFPKNTKIYCFFGQIPECIKHMGMVNKLKGTKKRVPITVIWENFPFHNQQLKNLIDRPFQVGTLYYSGHSKKLGHKISLDLGNQIVFYHFNDNLVFERLFWIVQGISMISADLGE